MSKLAELIDVANRKHNGMYTLFKSENNWYCKLGGIVGDFEIFKKQMAVHPRMYEAIAIELNRI